MCACVAGRGRRPWAPGRGACLPDQQKPGSDAPPEAARPVSTDNFRGLLVNGGATGKPQSSVRGSRPGFGDSWSRPAARQGVGRYALGRLPISPRGALGLSDARHASNRCGDGTRPRYSEHELSQARVAIQDRCPTGERLATTARRVARVACIWHGTDASSGPLVMPPAPILGASADDQPNLPRLGGLRVADRAGRGAGPGTPACRWR